MSKYIPADKLIAEIESRMEDCKLPNGKFPTTTNAVRYEELSCLRNYITSLQQEPANKNVNAEWNDADEEMLDAMIDIVSNSLYEPLCPREGMLAWLKSLRPQPHWKPSEVQVSILGKVFAGCELNTSERDSMVDLFYHIKDMI